VGKAETRVVFVPRWLTVFLWLLVSAGMAATIYVLSGHAYHRESSLTEIVAMLRRYDQGSASNSAVLAIIAPAIGDILFFLPWGALGFLSLDGPNRSRKSIYGVTVALGVAFALGLTVWQLTLPTRVTGGIDCLWGAVGCGAGAALGHARKRVRVRFD
jgi:VanZ family protein